MNNAPISVIIPTYNRKELLPRTIKSVLEQRLRCAEIIIVDDGSTDGTKASISPFLQQYDEIHYIFQKNQGAAAARNRGIAAARFPFLAFVDSDDHWHCEKIAQQYQAMQEHPEYLISHTKERWLRRGKHLNQKAKHIPRHGDIFAHCLALCAVGMSTVLVRKELFLSCGNFDSQFPCCEDYDFWLRVSCRYPFLLVDAPLTVKEGGRDDQLSQQFRVGMDKLRITAIQKLLASGQLTKEQYILASAEMRRKARIYGQGCLRHGRPKEARYYLEIAEDAR